MAGEERSEDRTSRGKLLEGATVGRRGGRDGRWQKDRAEERMGWAEEEIPLPHRQASPTGRAKCGRKRVPAREGGGFLLPFLAACMYCCGIAATAGSPFLLHSGKPA